MIPLSPYHVSVETMEQELLVIEASKKDPAAFRPLYEKYHEPIFRYIYQRSDDKEAAFDIAQQVFVKALINLSRYTFKGVPFSSWLYRIAKSEVYKAIEKNKVHRTVNVDVEGLKELLQETEADETSIQKEKSLTICMSQLADADVQLIEMRFFESRAFKEMGQILEMTENNAKVKVYRILEKLKKCILSIR
ncbi:RNA polymerase sigma factor [Cytophaga aurantiaca]|uniref:RNA polymerase sigma factor n=1 Tax=Cytophaga aurantiaca TaxID=29530 RepID=UPI000370AF8B|nr:sigma-70 family RNA polymerase sigma factor [Cytophaga aurantiaca]